MIDMKIWYDRDFSLVSLSFFPLLPPSPQPPSPNSQAHSLTPQPTQLLTILSCGFLGFPIFSFWIALYFQTQLNYNALMTGVHMLPMVIVGLTANAVAALVQHKVSNKLLVGIGAAALTVSFTLAAVQRYGDSYWAFSFPALCLCVIGVDFQFIVANVSFFTFQFRCVL